MHRTISLPILLAAVLLPAVAAADTAEEVRRTIVDYYAAVRETLQDPASSLSSGGALHFWSSGGLLQTIPPGADLTAYDAFDVYPRHIEVVTLVEGRAAVAMYYAEGSMKPKGFPAVGRYLTRVTEVFVREESGWKQRAGHWSPIVGGSGTTQPVQ